MRLWARGDLRIPGPGQSAPEQHVNKAAAAFGLVLEESVVLEEECFLWPENVLAFNLWLSVQTQWHTDNGMRVGLDYPGVDTCIRHMPIRKKQRAEYFAAVQSMERAALDEWDKER